MDNWKLIAQSNTRFAYVNTIVNYIPTAFIRTEEGVFFTLAIPREDLPKIGSRISELLLLKSRPIGGRIAVGGFSEKHGVWPLVDHDKDLTQWIEQAVKHFSGLIDNFGRWPSFNNFLKTDISYYVKDMPVESQLPLEYWWLVGKLGDNRPVHKTNQYKEAGIFIRPDNNILPLFTSSLYADLASQHYSQAYGFKLIPARIPCPSCYLSGLGELEGSEILKSALLNEQWHIRFFTCDERFYSGPSHFYISDTDGEEYALTGCPDQGTRPQWVIRRWGHDEQWFPKKCKPLPWSVTK